MTDQASLQTNCIQDATHNTEHKTEQIQSETRNEVTDRHREIYTREEVVSLLASTAPSARGTATFNTLADNFPSELLTTVWETLEIHQGWNRTLHTLVEPHAWHAMLHPCRTADEEASSGNLAVFEATCRALYRERRDSLTPFVCLAELQRAASKANAPGCSASDVPLYKRAASALPRPEDDPDAARNHVDLLLSSLRPQAVLRALQLLLRLGEAETAVTEATVRSKRNPLLRVEAFRLFVAEVGRSQLLDAQLERVFALCPATVTAEEVLREILKGAAEAGDVSGLTPFLFDAPGLTLGMVKPLLVRLLDDGADVDGGYVDSDGADDHGGSDDVDHGGSDDVDDSGDDDDDNYDDDDDFCHYEEELEDVSSTKQEKRLF